MELTRDEILPHLQKIICRNFVKANLVKKAQQIRQRKVCSLFEPVPHLHRSSYKLITARAFHSIDAHVSSADAHGIFRSPRARRIVLGRHQAMSRIERSRDRRTQIDIAKPHYEVVRIENDFLDVLNRIESIYATDKLDVVRAAPRRAGANCCHIFFNGDASLRIIPRKRQINRSCRDLRHFVLFQMFRKFLENF